MAISTQLSADGQELTIAIQGRFDFGAHQAFRDAYERVDGTPKRYQVDLQGTTYLDSSALGMLLLLRDHAGGDHAQIRLLNCNGDVRKILSVFEGEGYAIEGAVGAARAWALGFARRRRFGPYATTGVTDPARRERQVERAPRAGEVLAELHARKVIVWCWRSMTTHRSAA